MGEDKGKDAKKEAKEPTPQQPTQDVFDEDLFEEFETGGEPSIGSMALQHTPVSLCYCTHVAGTCCL